MRRILICIFLLLQVSRSQGQGAFQDQSYSFGEVAFWNNDTAWFSITNPSGSNLVFLPTFYNEQFRVLYDKKSVPPGATVKIGIVYYTPEAGKFSVDVPLYINQKPDPIVFHLKGNIKSFDPMAELRCPSMNGEVSENKMEKIIVVEVRDLNTDELLQPDVLSVRSRENKKINLEKDKLEFKMRAAPGSYRVSADKKGYNSYDALINLEPYQLKFIVYMDKLDLDEPPVLVVEHSDTGIMATDRNYEPIEENDTAEIAYEIPDTHVHPPKDSLPVSIPETGLSFKEFSLNNVIMIVDVSSSMNRGGKLDALKAAFNTLVDALRPEDRIAIVSMSSNAEVVQPSTGVYEKDSLKARLASMKAVGGTNGGAAIQLAYQLARDNFVPDGNNQVIIATDGIFYGGTMSRRQIEELIVKGNAEGIHLSTVAFGTDPKAVMFLQSLSEKGGGSFVQVTGNSQEETQLLEMIKTQSRRK